MTELLTAAQMRAIEQAAIAAGEVTGLELMERAGQGVVAAIFEEWPELDADIGCQAGEAAPRPQASPGDISGQKMGGEAFRRAVVLCGPGNNGGDGFVVARLLKERGWDIEVFLYGAPDKLPPDAKVNYERWLELGRVKDITHYGRKDGWLCDVLVDALFGTGLTRSLTDLGDLFWNMEDMVDCFEIEFGHKRGRPAIVAVDIPSGICSDSGKEFPHEADYFRFSATAHLTVSFHRHKQGHFLAEGPDHCGKTVVKEIGLKEGKNWCKENRKSLCSLATRLHPSWARKDRDGHKYSHGHALVLSGGHGRTGAARLAARGALRIGAGLVTVGAPRAAMMEHACQLTAIMLRQMDGADELRRLLQDSRFNAVCLGPGLGLAADREGLVLEVLQANRATVLDADALTQFEDRAEALFEVLHENCVITPHGGEFSRLFPDLAEKLNAPATTGPAYSKVDATREAAKRAGCVVLFKGPDTVIAAPNGLCSVNSAHYDRSAPWLATAGSGDVLAGFITGLMARGFDPMQAAETAAYLHVECALNFGPGLIAEDLPEQIPAVLRKLDIF
ncbi:yjeF, hydroxyethylthiazole kinase-related protein/yjeF [Phaeobacter piscinae]|uniref:Bifunctional NAD(P)H-hydrate repair enzyme n=1 Tax=Phaeobacter piscinae TaxID=1580596 RepID=A0AAN1GRB3_9RHOB|nr:NAD(P)H-hydrate dehydratase [Phaeobacter piscinae]ATG43699.1 yjeF, hydroxyethylthiazole kinase-related protein/yjeF [Phaeobacter piscinae]AUR36008.1 yjeF, hydroxyethylthiazole kinase-related protein/yjeF [Phaeobacter piscinae]